MLDLLAYLAEFFVWLYRADERPEARRITIGCGVVALAVIGFVGMLAVMQRMK